MFPTPNKASLSIIGLKSYNQHLFDDMAVPDGVDKTVLANNIIYDCAELEVIYPDPFFMQFAIGQWSQKELPIWQKVYEMENAEYNPLENYDRYDSETENTGRNRENQKTDVINSKAEAKSNTRNTGVTTSTNVDKVAAFNTDILQTNNQNVANNTDNGESNIESDSVGSSVQNTNDTGKENENRVKQLHSHGNIGVTTVAQMIRGQLEILPEVNTISYITESFKKRFCLLVY